MLENGLIFISTFYSFFRIRIICIGLMQKFCVGWESKDSLFQIAAILLLYNMKSVERFLAQHTSPLHCIMQLTHLNITISGQEC